MGSVPVYDEALVYLVTPHNSPNDRIYGACQQVVLSANTRAFDIMLASKTLGGIW